MKKMMTSAMALLLCLSMLFSFAACSGDNGGNGGENTVVGNWECIVDAGDLYSQMFGIDVGECEMRLTFNFTDNGQANMAFDLDHFKAQVPGLVDNIANSMASQAGMSADDFYAMAGMTRDQLIAQTQSQLEGSLSQANVNGTYEIEDNKIWLMTSGQSKDEENPMIFSFDGGKLLLTAGEGADVPEQLAGLLPLTLTRI